MLPSGRRLFSGCGRRWTHTAALCGIASLAASASSIPIGSMYQVLPSVTFLGGFFKWTFQGWNVEWPPNRVIKLKNGWKKLVFVYLPTWMVDFHCKLVGKCTIVPWILWDSHPGIAVKLGLHLGFCIETNASNVSKTPHLTRQTDTKWHTPASWSRSCAATKGIRVARITWAKT